MQVRQKDTRWQGLPQALCCCFGAELARCSDLMWHGSRFPWRYRLLGGKCENNPVFGCVFETSVNEMLSVKIRQEKCFPRKQIKAKILKTVREASSPSSHTVLGCKEHTGAGFWASLRESPVVLSLLPPFGLKEVQHGAGYLLLHAVDLDE